MRCPAAGGWPAIWYAVVAVAARGAAASVMASGSGWSCALTAGDQQPFCWGDNSGDLITQTLGKPPLQTIAGSFNQVCGIRKDGATVECWGRAHPDSTVEPPQYDVKTVRCSAIAPGTFHTCALTMDGQPVCWGSIDRQSSRMVNCNQFQKMPKNVKFTAISSGTSFTCGIEAGIGFMHCWYCLDDALEITNFKVRDLAANEIGVCVLHDGSSKLECFGRMKGTVGALPQNIKLSDLSAEYKIACGVSSSRPTCWGPNSDAFANEVAGPVVAVSVGRGHTCGLTSAGSITCWNAGGSAPQALRNGFLVPVGAGGAPAPPKPSPTPGPTPPSGVLAPAPAPPSGATPGGDEATEEPVPTEPVETEAGGVRVGEPESQLVIPKEHMAIIGVGLLVCCCGFGFLYLCCRAAAADDQKAAAHAAPRPPPPKWARVDAAKAKKPAAAPHGAAHVRGSAAAPVTPVPRGSATPAPRPVAPPAADNAPATPRKPPATVPQGRDAPARKRSGSAVTSGQAASNSRPAVKKSAPCGASTGERRPPARATSAAGMAAVSAPELSEKKRKKAQSKTQKCLEEGAEGGTKVQSDPEDNAPAAEDEKGANNTEPLEKSDKAILELLGAARKLALARHFHATPSNNAAATE